MSARRPALMLSTVLSLVATAQAAAPGPRDPDWPCQQIKVPRLSIAALWSGPPLDTAKGDWRQDQQVADLVQSLAPRRVSTEAAQEQIRAFAEQAGEQRQRKLLQTMDGLFSVLDDERSSVVAGLDRFGARQKELATTLREDNDRLRIMQADPAVDQGEVNQMLQRVTWTAQVFQDRRQSLRYACDVPGKIEQRLFILARAIRQALE